MSVEVRECDVAAAQEMWDDWMILATDRDVRDAARIIAHHMQPERSAAAEEIRRLRAVVEAADGLESAGIEFGRALGSSMFCEHMPDGGLKIRLLNAFVAHRDASNAYRTARAACDSQNAESDPQDGLSDTGDTQGGCDDSV